MPKALDAPLRPQILFIGFEPDDPGLKAMAALAANSAVVTAEDAASWIRTVRTAEWDVVVAREPTPGLSIPDHMFRFAMGAAGTGRLVRRRLDKPRDLGSPLSYSSRGEQPSMRIDVETNIEPAPLQRLVDHDLVQWLRATTPIPYLIGSGPNTGDIPARRNELVGTAFVCDADRHVIAGHFQRSRSTYLSQATGSWCLVLPHVPDAPAPWLRAILDVWRDIAPERFADLPTWWHRTEYRTVDESVAIEELASLEASHAAVVRAYERERTRLDDVLVAAENNAARGIRRLLTDQGQSLVDAVVQALMSIGYSVVDADAERRPGDAKQEDLRVSDPDAPEWTNITEVKGYLTGGAKTRDLQTLGRYASVFFRRTDGLPSSRWYVVNQHGAHPPDSRPPILQGAEEDIDVFAADGGLVVDTRELFALVQAVSAGRVHPYAARQSLRESVGKYAALRTAGGDSRDDAPDA